jgi:hypothetical protein
MAVRTLQLLVLLLLPSHQGLRAETLYNGIVLPSLWPPRINLTNRTSLSEPWYSTPAGRPPAVVVDVGRQLFIDKHFLMDPSGTNATIAFHAPALAEAPAGTRVGYLQARGESVIKCPSPLNVLKIHMIIGKLALGTFR